MPDAVLIEERGSVLVITLNRPESHNSINRAMSAGVAEGLYELDVRDDLLVGVITGAGGTFSGGMDLKAFVAGEDVSVPGRGFAGICHRRPTKPCIAAVEGWAVGGGLEIVLACDMVVAAEGSRFGLPEVKRGLFASAGGLLRLPRIIPPVIAAEMALTGDPLTAAEALRVGLVNAVVPTGTALEGALTLAARVTGNSPLALAATKALLDASHVGDPAEAWELQARLARRVFGSEDAAEGSRAFVEKREPVWVRR